MTVAQWGIIGCLVGFAFMLVRDIALSYVAAHRTSFVVYLFSPKIYALCGFVGSGLGIAAYYLWKM